MASEPRQVCRSLAVLLMSRKSARPQGLPPDHLPHPLTPPRPPTTVNINTMLASWAPHKLFDLCRPTIMGDAPHSDAPARPNDRSRVSSARRALARRQPSNRRPASSRRPGSSPDARPRRRVLSSLSAKPFFLLLRLRRRAGSSCGAATAGSAAPA
eukprot:4966447-Pyramimonas_sp.AAC.1